MNKNFENFKLFLSKCAHNFSIICLTETWNSDESFLNNSNFQLPNYNSIHFGRKNKRGGGICIFISDSLNFKRRNDLYTLEKANEISCLVKASYQSLTDLLE